MSIQFFDPVGELEVVERTDESTLTSLAGKRVAFIFNMHTSAQAFWKAFEQAVEQNLAPASLMRVHKANTWAPAPKADIARVLAETDYALIGVGA